MSSRTEFATLCDFQQEKHQVTNPLLHTWFRVLRHLLQYWT